MQVFLRVPELSPDVEAQAWRLLRLLFLRLGQMPADSGRDQLLRHMKKRPQVVAFDVVETLFALEPIRRGFRSMGLPDGALEIWFARLLRTAFALDATGVYKPFGEVALGTLEVLLAEYERPATVPALGHALSGFQELPAHDDVAPAFQSLREAAVRIVTLSNGDGDTTRQLLRRARLDRFVERVISIDEVRRWKPASEVYHHAAKVTGVAPDELALVAAHAWDIHGANQAGLLTGWVSRLEKRFNPLMNPPDVTGNTLAEVSERLLLLQHP